MAVVIRESRADVFMTSTPPRDRAADSLATSRFKNDGFSVGLRVYSADSDTPLAPLFRAVGQSQTKKYKAIGD